MTAIRRGRRRPAHPLIRLARLAFAAVPVGIVSAAVLGLI